MADATDREIVWRMHFNFLLKAYGKACVKLDEQRSHGATEDVADAAKYRSECARRIDEHLEKMPEVLELKRLRKRETEMREAWAKMKEPPETATGKWFMRLDYMLREETNG